MYRTDKTFINEILGQLRRWKSKSFGEPYLQSAHWIEKIKSHQDFVKKHKIIKVRYFLSSDDDGHDYLIPESKRKEWTAFRNIPSDDELSWDVPDFVINLGMSLELVTFENVKIKGKSI